jgi:hypothetical protein
MVETNDLIKLFVAYGILMSIGVLYDRYKRKEEKQDRMTDYDMIQKYILNDDSTLRNSKKPILWIHIDLEKNARSWESFGSRTSMELNQPYMFLTVRSLIQKCGDSFNVCLIDDSSFHKIIPGWSTKVNNLPAPIGGHLRELALANLLLTYGGLLMPASFICFQNLYPAYKEYSEQYDAFVGEMPARTSVTSQLRFFPSTRVMGCKRESPAMKAYIAHLERAVSNDASSEFDFNGEPGRWFFKHIMKGSVDRSGSGSGSGSGSDNFKIGQISADELGCRNARTQKPVLVEDLMSDYDFEVSPDALGIYIPADEILKRTAYQWFAELCPRKVLEANTMISKYLLVSE